MVMNSDKTKAYTWVFREVEVPYFYEDGLKMDIALIEMDVVQKATTIITTSSALGITNRDSNSSKMARTGEYLFFTNNNLAFKMNMTTKVITAVSELAGTTLNGNIGSKIIFTKSSPVGLFVANEDGSVSQVSSVSNIPNYSAGLNIDSQAVEGSLLDNYGYGVVKNNKAYISVNGSLSVIDLSTMNLSVLVNSDVLKILTVDGNNVVITKKTSIPYPWCNQCGSMDVISGIMTYNLTSQQSSTVVNFQYSQYESSMSDNSFVVIGRELYFGGAVIQNTTSVGSELYKLNLDTMAISLVFDREGSREAQNWNTGETDIVQYSSQPYNFVKDSNGMGYATMQTGDNEYKVVKLDGSLTTIITDGSIIYAFYPLTENKMFFATRYQSSFKYIQEDQVLSGGGYNGASVSLNDKFFIMNGNILMKNDYSDPNGQRLSGRYFFRIKY